MLIRGTGDDLLSLDLKKKKIPKPTKILRKNFFSTD